MAGWRLPDGWRDAMPEVAEWYDRAAHINETIEITELPDGKKVEIVRPERGDT